MMERRGMDDFNWVKALSACTLSTVFERLKLQVQEAGGLLIPDAMRYRLSAAIRMPPRARPARVAGEWVLEKCPGRGQSSRFNPTRPRDQCGEGDAEALPGEEQFKRRQERKVCRKSRRFGPTGTGFVDFSCASVDSASGEVLA